MGQILNNRLADTDVVPGSGFSFSISDIPTPVEVSASFGVSNIVHKTTGGVAVLPEENTTLPSVVRDSPERRRPTIGSLTVAPSGGNLVFTGAPGVQKGVYEVTSDIDSYAPVMAELSFKVRPGTWSENDAPYWADSGLGLAPVYFGLEYGIRNSGLFVFLGRDGVIYSGGPLTSYGDGGRAGVEMSSFAWDSLADNSEVKLHIIFAGHHFWLYASASTLPLTLLRTGTIGDLDVFELPESGFSQSREGPSTQARLFFGCTGGSGDTVEVMDFGLFPYFPKAMTNGETEPAHNIKAKANAPNHFLASDQLLPNDPTCGWKTDGTVPPTVNFGYQPGRPATPLWAEVRRSAPGTSFLSREANPQAGCYLEAWMCGELGPKSSIHTGIGLEIRTVNRSYKVVAIDAGTIRTYGIVKNDDALESLNDGYWLPLDADGNIVQLDYTALRLVRLALREETGTVELFVEDLSTPVLTVALASFSAAPTLAQGYFAIGHVGSTSNESGVTRFSTVSYAAKTLVAWRRSDVGDPTSAGLVYTDIATANYSSQPNNALRVEKTTYGQDDSLTLAAVSAGATSATYRQGFQVEFRTKVVSYTNSAGVSGMPLQWTGVGLRMTFPVSEQPQPIELQLGFFDCGFFGKKVGFLTGNVTADDILNQTAVGMQHSASVDWSVMTDYRLVYIPGHRIQLYSSGYTKNSPIIDLPWRSYQPKQASFPDRPSFQFGNFNPRNAALSEWELFQVSVSDGYDFAITPVIKALTDWSFGGRAVLLLDYPGDPEPV